MSKKKTEENTKKKEAKKVELQEEKQLTTEELLVLEKDQHLRLIAEFDNFRRRTAKERISLFSTAGQDIMIHCCQFWTIWKGQLKLTIMTKHMEWFLFTIS